MLAADASTATLPLLIGIVAAYLLGSISGAILVCRVMKIDDPRLSGSGNPGATNMLRIAGTAPAVTTLLIDSLKGMLAVAIGILLNLGELELALCGLMAIAGHMFPAFHGFKGGKGVATTLGVGLVLAPTTTLFLASIWTIIAWRTRVSSFASVTAALMSPFASYLLNPDQALTFTLLASAILIRHRQNLGRILKGQEKPLK